MSTTPNPNARYGVGGYGVGRYGSAPISNLPIGYYTSIITSEYQLSPNFIAWLTAALRKLDDISQCLAGFVAAFDLDSAIGPQLDTLGLIVGQGRTVGFQPSNGVSPILDDTTYRILLKARIAQNSWNGQIGSLQAIWQNLFPGGRIAIQDNQNMTATVILSGSFTSIISDLITNGYIVPRPQAVEYTFVRGTAPYLGYDENNGYVAGWDTGHYI